MSVHAPSRSLWQPDIHFCTSGLAGFWAQMSSGADLMTATPPDRWDADARYTLPGAKAGIYARHGAYCAGMQHWDAAFYKLPANEALAMDPHTRALLDLSQAALHTAPSRASQMCQYGLQMRDACCVGGAACRRTQHVRQRGRLCGLHVGARVPGSLARPGKLVGSCGLPSPYAQA